MNTNKIFSIALCGGSASGKTYLAKLLAAALGEKEESILSMDSFYHDQSKYFDRDGGNVNFDHPEAFDFDLFYQQILNIKENGFSKSIPVYSFKKHSREVETQTKEIEKFLIVDGIYSLYDQRTLQEYDLKVFISAPTELRLKRRIERDTQSRGRSQEGIIEQFNKHVEPMHQKFLVHQKKLADLIIQMPEEEESALKKVLAQIPTNGLHGKT